jgi:hypothetical protein
MLESFVRGSGSGKMHDFYAATCDSGAPIISDSCHHNPNSASCDYIPEQGTIVAILEKGPAGQNIVDCSFLIFY